MPFRASERQTEWLFDIPPSVISAHRLEAPGLPRLYPRCHSIFRFSLSETHFRSTKTALLSALSLRHVPNITFLRRRSRDTSKVLLITAMLGISVMHQLQDVITTLANPCKPRAMAPSSADCLFSQTSIAGSRLTDPEYRSSSSLMGLLCFISNFRLIRGLSPHSPIACRGIPSKESSSWILECAE